MTRVVLFLSLIAVSYTLGYLTMKAKHDTYTSVAASISKQIEADVKEVEGRFNEHIRDLNKEMASRIRTYQEGINTISDTYSNRLQQSEDRANRYKQMSEAGESERELLAEHTRRLDESLERGRLVAGRLKATLAESVEANKMLKEVIDTYNQMLK